MTVTVALSERGLEHIRSRLDALELDIALCPIGRDGRVVVAGEPRDPADIDIDYLWLTTDLYQDGLQERAFETALALRSLGVLQTYNAGLDDPFYAAIAAKGVRVCNSSAQAVAIAEYVMAQVLGVLQPLDRQRALQAGRHWEKTPFREISQTDWLIAGFGHIGTEIARRVRAFGAGISVVRRTAAPSELADRVGTMADLAAFAAQADVVVLACSLNDATRGMADTGFFEAMKADSLLVNIARGGLVDEAALLAALDRGRPATAVLDVFATEPLPEESPLWAHPRIRLTAHTSFFGSGVRTRWDALFLDNIQRYLRGETLINEVDPTAM